MTALITGASSGIGRELAKEFAKDHIDVILVARSKDKLETLAKELENEHQIRAFVIVQDLTKHEAAHILYEKVKLLNQSVDFLVNNAGFGDYKAFINSSLKKQEDMIVLNISTLTSLTHLFLQDMKIRKSGTILNVASTAAFQPGPFMSVYFATKHYVMAFSEAIAEELKPLNIKVCTLCPGPTESEFGDSSGFKMLKNAHPNKFPSSAEVASFAYQKMKKGKVVFIHGIWNTIQAHLARLFPKTVVRKVTYLKMK